LLAIVVSSQVTNEVVTVRARMLMGPVPRGGQPDQEAPPEATVDPRNTNIIQDIVFVTTPAPGNGTQSFVLPLAEGYLLGVTASTTSASTSRGQTFVRCSLTRTNSNVGNQRLVLFSDYATNIAVASWPYGRQLSPTEGPGWIHGVQAATPGAGADWSFTAGNAQRLHVLSFSATFTAAVAVASRNITIIVDDTAGNIVWQDDVTAAVTASQVASINATQTNVPVGVIATTLFAVIPPGLQMQNNVGPATRIRSLTGNIQGADQWSAIFFLVEQLIDNG